jgi:hypothetical protein
LAPQFWQKAVPARLCVPHRGHAWVPSGAPGRSTVVATPAATRRWPQFRQKARPGRFSVPQRGHWVLSPVVASVSGTPWAAAALAATAVAPDASTGDGSAAG